MQVSAKTVKKLLTQALIEVKDVLGSERQWELEIICHQARGTLRAVKALGLARDCDSTVLRDAIDRVERLWRNRDDGFREWLSGTKRSESLLLSRSAQYPDYMRSIGWIRHESQDEADPFSENHVHWAPGPDALFAGRPDDDLEGLARAIKGTCDSGNNGRYDW